MGLQRLAFVAQALSLWIKPRLYGLELNFVMLSTLKKLNLNSHMWLLY